MIEVGTFRIQLFPISLGMCDGQLRPGHGPLEKYLMAGLNLHSEDDLGVRYV